MRLGERRDGVLTGSDQHRSPQALATSAGDPTECFILGHDLRGDCRRADLATLAAIKATRPTTQQQPQQPHLHQLNSFGRSSELVERAGISARLGLDRDHPRPPVSALPRPRVTAQHLYPLRAARSGLKIVLVAR